MIMTGSALYGQPPNSERDYKIVRGLLFSYGFPESTDPALGFPTNQHAPPGYHFETRGPGVIAGLVVAILLSFLITGTRLLLRACRKDLRWGLDDWVIVPAVVGPLFDHIPLFRLTMRDAAGYDELDWLPDRNGHTWGSGEAHLGCEL